MSSGVDPQPAGRKAVNILLLDDHVLFRAGMRFLLRSLDPDLVMDEAGKCADALELLGRRGYDLILLDLNLPDLSGLEALAELRGGAPSMPLVVLSGENDPGVVRAAIELGAMGYIPKSTTTEVLIHALRLVLAGGVYLPQLALNEAYQARASAPVAPRAASSVLLGLTPRQMDVLRRVIKGLPNKLIARELDLTEGTVKAHLSAVFHALDVHSRTEAVYVAAKLGLRLA